MRCRVCDSGDLEPVIDLGQQPWCNNFLHADEIGKEPYYPLRVVYCHNCKTAQLDFTVPKEIMFGDHTYLSGVTQSLSEHFRTVAEAADNKFFKHKSNKSILDIGSNDGTQLKHYKNLGYHIQGVESSKTTADIANQAGLSTLNDFFNLNVAKSLGRKYQLINASGVFFHLEELHSVTEGIYEALADDGVFIVQFLYMKQIMENMAFDQIYHEHLLYYNIETINQLLSRHDLHMFDAYLSPIHGGSIIGYIAKKQHKKSDRLNRLIADENMAKANDIDTYKAFYDRIQIMKAKNIEYLEKQKKAQKTVYGMGAPVKGNTLLNYFGVGCDHIQFLVEKNKLRKNLYSPGTHIQIVLEDELQSPPDVYYVLAWNFKKEILVNNQALVKQGTEFYFPVDPVVIKS